MLEQKLDHVMCLLIDKKDKIVQDRSNKFFTKMVKGKHHNPIQRFRVSRFNMTRAGIEASRQSKGQAVRAC